MDRPKMFVATVQWPEEKDPRFYDTQPGYVVNTFTPHTEDPANRILQECRSLWEMGDECTFHLIPLDEEDVERILHLREQVANLRRDLNEATMKAEIRVRERLRKAKL